MSFEEAYTEKTLLKRQTEESAFRDLVQKLIIQKNITKSEAIRIASERLRERRANALKISSYTDRIAQIEEEKQLASIRRGEKEKAKLEGLEREALEREKVRTSLRDLKKRTLEAQEATELIKMAMQGVPLETDIIGRELAVFEGKIGHLLGILQYGMATAETLTGKPDFMLRNEKVGLLTELSNWAKRKWDYMSSGERVKFQDLTKRLTT